MGAIREAMSQSVILLSISQTKGLRFRVGDSTAPAIFVIGGLSARVPGGGPECLSSRTSPIYGCGYSDIRGWAFPRYPLD